MPRLVHQGEEEAVPQPRAGIQDRLGLGDGEDPRQFPRCLQRDRPPAIRLPPAHVMKERLPAAPPASPPRGQQVPGAVAVAGLMRVERAHRGELAVNGRHADLRDRRRQHRDLARPARRRQLQPDHELGDVLQPGLAPVQPPEAEKLPEVFHVVGVRLDRVRRPADVSEIGQEPVDRGDRRVVVPQHGPRSRPRTGDHHRMHEHRLFSLNCVIDRAGDNHGSTLIRAGEDTRDGR